MIKRLKKIYFHVLIKAHMVRKKINLSSMNVRFDMSSNIDKNSIFEGANRIGSRTSFRGEIGFGSYIGSNCKISAKIGKYCSIASNVETLSGTHPSTKFVSTSPVFFSLQKQSGISYVKNQKFKEYKRICDKYDVVIGNDVWIGKGVSIIGGVCIGDGAIVAANATVTKDVQPYTIVAGIPSEVIRNRFETDQINYLIKYKWWNKEQLWLIKNADLFEDIDKFIQSTQKELNKEGIEID